MDVHWRPYYMVVEKTGPVSSRIRNQLIGSVTKAYAEYIRAASVEEWENPTTEKPLGKIVLANLESSSDSDSKSRAEQTNLNLQFSQSLFQFLSDSSNSFNYDFYHSYINLFHVFV